MVEHGFSGVKQNFKLLHLRTSALLFLLPVFAFLYNFRTCMRGGNQISEMFDLLLPLVEEYTSGNIEVRKIRSRRKSLSSKRKALNWTFYGNTQALKQLPMILSY